VSIQRQPLGPGPLSEAELDDLLSRRLIASLAIQETGGSIRVLPMWFRRDNDSILIPTSQRTRKVRMRNAGAQAAVMIHQAGEGLDLRGALIRGPLEVIEGERARQLNRSVHVRYVTEPGLELPEVRVYLGEGDDVTLCVQMHEVVTWNLAGMAAANALRRPWLVHALD
jgi:nitroimidazol reductase NimA-like FMN-containing flavoprotein (pyridoxamine 5'-phosphate oxidase superfamily)